VKSQVVLRADNKVDLLLIWLHIRDIVVHGDHVDSATVFCVVSIKTEEGVFVVVVSEQTILNEELEVIVPLLIPFGISFGLVIDQLQNTTC